MSKVKKSAERPSDVSEWRTYSSPSEAIDEAVRGAHDQPDEAELNDEVAEIRRANPGLSPFAAHMEAARRHGDDNLQAQTRKSDPVDALGESLSEVHAQARRDGLNAHQRQVLAKASRAAEETYLRETRPWAVSTSVDLRKAEADDDLLSKAERIKKSDQTRSRFESLRRAARRAA